MFHISLLVLVTIPFIVKNRSEARWIPVGMIGLAIVALVAGLQEAAACVNSSCFASGIYGALAGLMLFACGLMGLITIIRKRSFVVTSKEFWATFLISLLFAGTYWLGVFWVASNVIR